MPDAGPLCIFTGFAHASPASSHRNTMYKGRYHNMLTCMRTRDLERYDRRLCGADHELMS
eukprot:1262799-Pyramimonas_sp.AAC.1